MAKVIGSITDVLSNVRANAGGRPASNPSPNPEAESYSQPSAPGNQGNAQAPRSDYYPPAGDAVPASAYYLTSRDPYNLQYSTCSVSPSAGDSPITRLPAPYFLAQDPYGRPSEGTSVSPADPRAASGQTGSTTATGVTKVSYDGAHG